MNCNFFIYNSLIIKDSKIIFNFKPQIIFPIGGAPFYNEFTSYGFGWWLTPKNGHKIIEHSGGIDGMSANLVMIKDLNMGFVILTNDGEEPAIWLLTSEILEKLLDDKAYDMYDLVKEYRDENLKKKKESPTTIEKIANTKPSLKLTEYAGTYGDKMYGDIFINYLDNDELEISFSHSKVFRGKLKHWHFDTFQIDWYDIRVPNGFLTFNFNAKRELLGFSMDQDNLLDVDFGELDIKKL